MDPEGSVQVVMLWWMVFKMVDRFHRLNQHTLQVVWGLHFCAFQILIPELSGSRKTENNTKCWISASCGTAGPDLWHLRWGRSKQVFVDVDQYKKTWEAVITLDREYISREIYILSLLPLRTLKMDFDRSMLRFPGSYDKIIGREKCSPLQKLWPVCMDLQMVSWRTDSRSDRGEHTCTTNLWSFISLKECILCTLKFPFSKGLPDGSEMYNSDLNILTSC